MRSVEDYLGHLIGTQFKLQGLEELEGSFKIMEGVEGPFHNSEAHVNVSWREMIGIMISINI